MHTVHSACVGWITYKMSQKKLKRYEDLKKNWDINYWGKLAGKLEENWEKKVKNYWKKLEKIGGTNSDLVVFFRHFTVDLKLLHWTAHYTIKKENKKLPKFKNITYEKVN